MRSALDSLATLVAPTATVVRDGESRRIPAAEVVEGDLVLLAAGDGVVADGELQLANGLTLDESILTGESRPTTRRQGETVRSGSFVVEGVGEQLVDAVGADSYAARVTGEARAFRHPRSPLERALNKLLLTLVAVIVPLGLVLGSALWERDAPISEAVPTSVAAVVTLVPEGLILLASLTYAVSALRMAQRGALAQQLNAVESLAAVDVVCLDKTGTLTEPRLRLVELVGDGRPALDRYAASAPGQNATLTAIAEAFPQPRRRRRRCCRSRRGAASGRSASTARHTSSERPSSSRSGRTPSAPQPRRRAAAGCWRSGARPPRRSRRRRPPSSRSRSCCSPSICDRMPWRRLRSFATREWS